MKGAYVLKESGIRSENRVKDRLEFAVNEGDIVLDKGFRFEVLPASRDFTKPITRKKLSEEPKKQNDERLLRIKKLGEASAVVAILSQESYCEGSDTIVIKEIESERTVGYAEEFLVYAKQQIMDLPGAITYRFVITDTSKPQAKEPRFCSECGVRLTKGDRFCRECGTPAAR